jgi:hypothetical protein
MQRENDLFERCGQHLPIGCIKGGYDLARSIDCVCSFPHVPIDFSCLRPVHCLDPFRFKPGLSATPH